MAPGGLACLSSLSPSLHPWLPAPSLPPSLLGSGEVSQSDMELPKSGWASVWHGGERDTAVRGGHFEQ